MYVGSMYLILRNFRDFQVEMQSDAEMRVGVAGYISFQSTLDFFSQYLIWEYLGHISAVHISPWVHCVSGLPFSSRAINYFFESINKKSSDFQSESFPVLKAAQHLVSQPNTDITWPYSSFHKDGCDEHMNLQDHRTRNTHTFH